MSRSRLGIVASFVVVTVWVLVLAVLIGWGLVGVIRWATDDGTSSPDSAHQVSAGVLAPPRAAPAAYGQRRYPPASSPVRFTEATLNVLHSNSPRAVSHDVVAAMRQASVVRLQEVWSDTARAGVRRALAQRPRWQHYPANLRAGPAADVILWSPRWRTAGPAGTKRLTGGVHDLTPSRYLVWVTLARHVRGAPAIPTTFANTHAVSGYCKAHRPRAELRDRLAASHWSKVARWTRAQLAAHPRRSILLGGDFNCSLHRTGRGTPGQYLRRLYWLDKGHAIDRLLTVRGVHGSPRTLDRWSLPARSDHRLHLRTLTVPQ